MAGSTDQGHPQIITLGAFELHEQLATGGMCTVWRGVHREQRVPVAIKVVDRHNAWRQQALLEAFFTEARTMAGLNHPHIITLLDFGQIPQESAARSRGRLGPGSPYLVMELASGGALQRWMPDNWADARALLLKLLDALAHAHAAGVIHRDIKPGNILQCQDHDARPGVKLTDFGIAHIFDPKDDSNIDPLIKGTPQYMAPEQIKGDRRLYGPWTDLYAMGCLAYRILCGKAPFQSDMVIGVVLDQLQRPFPDLDPIMEVPPGLEAWLEVMTAKEPSERFQCAADAAWALAQLEFSGPGRTRSTSEQAMPTLAQVMANISPQLHGPDQNHEVPPLPTTWRTSEPPSMALPLVGVGLRLFHLRALPIIGRHKERDVLWKALHNVTLTRKPHMLLLSGPSGMGKTHLTEWLTRRAHELGAAITLKVNHHARPEYGDGLRQPFAQLLQAEGLGHAELVEHLGAWFGQQRPENEHRALAQWLQPSPDPKDRAMAFPDMHQRFYTLRWLLDQAVHQRPIILWLEDLQWGIDAINFAHFLIDSRSSRARPILLIATVRREAPGIEAHIHQVLELLEANERVEHIELSPMSRKEQRTLIETLLGLDRVLIERILERTAGNPLFTIELIGNWIQGGHLEFDGRGFVLKSDADTQTPEQLRRIWEDHLLHLTKGMGNGARQALELAAILGPQVNNNEWKAVCQRAGAKLSANLMGRLVQEQLARPTPGGWAFVHDTLIETLLRTAETEGRLMRHCLHCVEALRDDAKTAADLERLGTLCLRAGDTDGADKLLSEAGQAYMTRADHKAHRRVLDLMDQSHQRAHKPHDAPGVMMAQLSRVWVLIGMGQLKEATQALTSFNLQHKHTRPSAQVNIFYLRVRTLLAFERGELDTCLRMANDLIAVSDRYGSLEERIRARLALSAPLRLQGDLNRANTVLTDANALLHHEAEPATDLLPRIQYQRAACLGAIQMWHRAAPLLQDAIGALKIDLKDTGVDRQLLGRVLELMGTVHRHGLGDNASARIYYERALKAATGRGELETLSKRINLAYIDIATGHNTTAIKSLISVHKFMKNYGFKRLEPWVQWGMLAAMAGLGRWDHWHTLLPLGLEALEGHRDLDLAWLASVSVERCIAAGHNAYALALLPLVQAQWEALQRPEEVERLEAMRFMLDDS